MHCHSSGVVAMLPKHLLAFPAKRSSLWERLSAPVPRRRRFFSRNQILPHTMLKPRLCLLIVRFSESESEVCVTLSEELVGTEQWHVTFHCTARNGANFFSPWERSREQWKNPEWLTPAFGMTKHSKIFSNACCACDHSLTPEQAPPTPHILQLGDHNNTLKRSHKEEKVAATNFSRIKKDSSSHTVAEEVTLYFNKFSVGWCVQVYQLMQM